MIKGKTKSGFAFEVRERAMEDVRFQKLLTLLNSKKKRNYAKIGESFFEFADVFIGEGGVEALLEHIAENDPDGLAPFEKVSGEIFEIVAIVQEKSKTAKK